MIYQNSKGEIVSKKSDYVDFIFVYEVKTRELQGITLMGYELVKRGYSVAYVNTWHELHRSGPRISAKVAVLFESYNDKVIGFALSFVEKCDYSINMQWEQILTARMLKPGNICYLTGGAKEVYHFSWGEANLRHLVDTCGIPEKMIRKVGHIGHDFVRPQLKGYYKTREEICEEFGLDTNKRIELFISSFPTQVDAKIKYNASDGYKELAENSRDEILRWFKKYLAEHEDVMFIYRPHPTEQLLPEFIEGLEATGGFRIISDYSIQQWITIVNDVILWRSTSVADVYMAGRGCMSLMPYDLPDEDVYFMFKNANEIKTYEQFSEQMALDEKFPIDDETMHYHYEIDDEPVYLKQVRVLEELYNCDEPKVPERFFSKRAEQGSRWWLDLRNYYGYMKVKIPTKLGIKKYKDSYELADYHRNMDKKNNATEKEIIQIMKHLDKIITANRQE